MKNLKNRFKDSLYRERIKMGRQSRKEISKAVKTEPVQKAKKTKTLRILYVLLIMIDFFYLC